MAKKSDTPMLDLLTAKRAEIEADKLLDPARKFYAIKVLNDLAEAITVVKETIDA